MDEQIEQTKVVEPYRPIERLDVARAIEQETELREIDYDLTIVRTQMAIIVDENQVRAASEEYSINAAKEVLHILCYQIKQIMERISGLRYFSVMLDLYQDEESAEKHKFNICFY